MNNEKVPETIDQAPGEVPLAGVENCAVSSVPNQKNFQNVAPKRGDLRGLSGVIQREAYNVGALVSDSLVSKDNEQFGIYVLRLLIDIQNGAIERIVGLSERL